MTRGKARSTTMAMVWAGRAEPLLSPLTAHRAAPAVPFGGVYRLVDFTLSNLVNSGLTRIAVLTQYKSYSLHRHLARAWQLPPVLGQYVLPVPAQQRRGNNWYRGNADAIYQSLNVIHREQPDQVIVTGAEQVYRTDLGALARRHAASGAEVTMVATWQSAAEPARFGVIHVAADDPCRVTSCTPQVGAAPAQAPDPAAQAEPVLVSTGVYVLRTRTLQDAVTRDQSRPGSTHDMADVICDIINRGSVRVDLLGEDPTSSLSGCGPYWRDITTIDQYLQAQWDLLSDESILTPPDDRWPIYAEEGHHAAATVLADRDGRPGQVTNSILSPGVTVTGARIDKSILSPQVRVQGRSTISTSIVFHHVRIGRGCTIRDAVIDNDVIIPDGVRIGVDHECDRARGLRVTAAGTVLVGSRQTVPAY